MTGHGYSSSSQTLRLCVSPYVIKLMHLTAILQRLEGSLLPEGPLTAGKSTD